MADTTYNSNMLINRWAAEAKILFDGALMADQAVKWITEFPDGSTFYIPTFSDMNVRSRTEGDEVILDDVNTGRFEMTIDKQYQTGFGITDELKEDSYYVSQLISHYSNRLVRALMEKKEYEVFELQSSQTAGNTNTIDGAAHRLAGSGTSNVIALADFYKAKYALSKSNVPPSSWKAFLSPESTYNMGLIDNVFRQDVYGANSHIKEGLSMSTYLGMFGGFQCYESNFLDTDSGSTSIDGTTSITDPIYNVLCAGGETFVGAMRRNIDIESWRINAQLKDAYSATVRYGLKLYRPETLITIATPSSI